MRFLDSEIQDVLRLMELILDVPSQRLVIIHYILKIIQLWVRQGVVMPWETHRHAARGTQV